MVNAILSIITDILEDDTITLDTHLDDENWDSLNVISFIAAINSNFGIVLDAEETGKADSVKSLISMVEIRNNESPQ